MPLEVDEYLSKVEEHYEIDDDYEMVIRFALCCISSFHPVVPSFCEKQLDVANQYWSEGNQTVERLEEAREQCWRFLDDYEGSDKEVVELVVRAIIFVLHPVPSPDQDLFDALHWLCTIAGKLGCSKTVEQELVRIFPV